MDYLEVLEINLVKNELVHIWKENDNQEQDWDDGNDDRESYEDQTDWTYYDDNLDMYQQSPDFWNQF